MEVKLIVPEEVSVFPSEELKKIVEGDFFNNYEVDLACIKRLRNAAGCLGGEGQQISVLLDIIEEKYNGAF